MSCDVILSTAAPYSYGGGSFRVYILLTLAWNGDRTFPAGFEPHFGKNFSLRNFGNSVYPACQCLSDETVKAFGPFYLVSMAMPGEVTSNRIRTQNDGILCL